MYNKPPPVPQQIPPHMQNALGPHGKSGAQTQPLNFHRNQGGGGDHRRSIVVNQSNSFGNSSTSVSGGDHQRAQRDNSAGSRNSRTSKQSKQSYLSTTHSMQQKKALNGIQKMRPGQVMPAMVSETPSQMADDNQS